MTPLSKLVALLAAISVQAPAMAASPVHTSTQKPAHVPEGVKLPFDPIFCDLNENENIDAEEISPDNLCIIEGSQDIFSEKPISSFGLRKGQLLLTIDDGPNPRVTGPILDLLDQYGIKASFFMVGRNVQANQALVREVAKRGHLVANHSYTHDFSKINPTSIVGEVVDTYKAISSALGGPQQGRLLMRSPGLAWAAARAQNLNNNPIARRYIGPIHANLGTDAPRADWDCWTKGRSAEQCADWYFYDIMNAGRGVILMHDVYFRPGRPNSYEMLKILLRRLHNEGGGIKNRSGSGVWEFMRIETSSMLDQFDVGGSTPAPQPPVVKRTADGFLLIENFSRSDVFVRTEVLAEEGVATANSLISVGSRNLKTSDLVAVADMGQSINVGGNVFKRVRIEKAKSGLEELQGGFVYIWSNAF